MQECFAVCPSSVRAAFDCAVGYSWSLTWNNGGDCNCCSVSTYIETASISHGQFLWLSTAFSSFHFSHGGKFKVSKGCRNWRNCHHASCACLPRRRCRLQRSFTLMGSSATRARRPPSSLRTSTWFRLSKLRPPTPTGEVSVGMTAERWMLPTYIFLMNMWISQINAICVTFLQNT